jgi:hypothetical protein
VASFRGALLKQIDGVAEGQAKDRMKRYMTIWFICSLAKTEVDKTRAAGALPKKGCASRGISLCPPPLLFFFLPSTLCLRYCVMMQQAKASTGFLGKNTKASQV